MILFRWRSITISISMLFLALLFLAACSGSSTQAQTKPTPTLPPTPTPEPGQRILAKAANTFNTAKSLHGLFNLNVSGQTFTGTINSEIWNVPPAKNRIEVRQSSVPQIATGSVTVTDGKQIWQYDPEKKVVYSGAVPTNANGVPNSGFAGGGQGQFLLNLVQNIFTHSDATLKSSSAFVNGHNVYDLHVVPEGSATDTGVGTFNYAGEVYIDKVTALPVKVALNIQGIGNVVLDVPTLDLNQSVPANTFTFVPPPGTNVLPLQQATQSAGSNSLSLVQAQQQAGYHLLSISSDQSDYVLEGVNALGTPGNQIYTLNYMKGNISFTIAQGKPLANLPDSTGKHISLRGTSATLSAQNGATTLAWTEKGVGIRITGNLSTEEITAIAKSLA